MKFSGLNIPSTSFPGMGKMKFIPTPRLNELVQPELLAEMLRRAEAIAEEAREIAPVGEYGEDEQKRRSGDYRDSIVAESGFIKDETSGGEPRAVGRVNAKDWKSHWIEFGTVKWKGYGTLEQAAERAGYRLTSGAIRGGRGRSRE